MSSSIIVSNISTINYVTAPIDEIKVKVLGKSKGKYTYSATFDNKPIQVSQRFFNSLGSRFGLNQNIFNYFTPSELFNRVVKKHGKGAEVQFAVEMDNHGEQKRVLAVSGAEAKTIQYDQAVQFLLEKGGREISYDGNGRLSALFRPIGGEQAFAIGGDDFKQEYLCSISVDGYGKTDIALAFERLICMNDIVGLSSAFRAPIKLGKDNPMHGLNRAIDTYANEEGYEVIAERISTAQQTLASVSEVQMLARILDKCEYNSVSGNYVLGVFSKMVGDLTNLYGEASMDAFSSRKQSLLPTKASVYQILNFITELSSHHAKCNAKLKLQGLAGTLLSKEFDLEGFENSHFQQENNSQAFYLDESSQVAEQKRVSEIPV